MATLSPLVRLSDLTTDKHLAATARLLDWEIGHALDRPMKISVTVAASEAGGADTPTTAPGVTLTTGGALSAGAYRWAYSFVVSTGYTATFETPLSPASAAQTATLNQSGSLSAIGTGPAWLGVTARKVYRTLHDGATYYLVATIADNTTTTYSDTSSDATITANGAAPSVPTFATALMTATTAAGVNVQPTATLLGLSLDGGTAMDGYKLVEHTVRGLHSGGPTLQESGDDIWALYGTVGVDRATYTSMYLADVLGKAKGAIQPIQGAWVTQPSATTTTSALDAGAHTWKYSTVTNGVESVASAASTALTTTAGQGAIITVPKGGGGTTSRRIYRNSLTAAATWRLVKVLTDNTTTAWTDTIADSAIATANQPPAPWGFITGSGTTPILGGLLLPAAAPSAAAWPAGSKTKLAFTAVVDQTIAWLQTSVDIYADYIAKAVDTIAKRLGGVYLTGDTVQQGTRGHLVADSSDAAINVSSSFAGVVCNGSPTPAAPGTYSNALGAGGVARTATLGVVGSSPGGVAFTFDGSSSVPLTPAQEASTARPWMDGVTITPDMQSLYGQCSFIGGASNAGFPANVQLTALTTLNSSGGGSAWTDRLPIFGANVQDRTGGLYYYMGDGQAYLFYNFPPTPVYDIAVDTQNSQIYVATGMGVLKHSTDVKDRASAWIPAGTGTGLNYRVTKLAGLVVSSVFYCYALASGNGKGKDGIYLYPAVAGSPTTAGYNGWTFLLASPTLITMTATDEHGVWYVHTADPNKLVHFDNTLHTHVTYALPAGVTVAHSDVGALNRVIGVGGGQDSVWLSTTGDTQGVYYLVASAGSYVGQTLQKGNLDASLAGPLGKQVTVYRVTAIAQTINGQTVNMVACTSNGLYYFSGTIPTSGMTGWQPMNGQNGLDGVPITAVAAGAPQTLLGDTAVSRLYALNGTQFFHSNSSGVWWTDLTRSQVHLGPALSALVYDASGDLPTNLVQTLGPGASSPLGLASNTHVQHDGILPTGWYIQRLLDERYNWTYRLVNGNVTLPSLMYHQVNQLQTNESVSLITASSLLLQTQLRWLGQNSAAQTILSIPSSFTQDTSGLRKLRPTMKVAVTFSGSILQQRVSGTGPVSTTYVALAATPFYVLDHTIRSPRGGDGQAAETITTLGTLLRTGALSPDDIAAGLMDAHKNVVAFGVR